MIASARSHTVVKNCALFFVLITASCNVDGKSNRSGFDENLLIVRDAKGNQLNRHVYRIRDPITYETYSQGVCGVAGSKENQRGEITGEFVVKNSLFNFTRAATRSKYYVDLTGPFGVEKEWAGFFFYRACREKNPSEQLRNAKFITINFSKIDHFEKVSSRKIVYNRQGLTAPYFKGPTKICEVRLKFEGYFIVGSEIDFVSKGEILPLLNEPDQLACLYRGVLASVGYFGYLNMPISKLLDPQDSNYDRNPLMIKGDATGPTGITGFWPFLSTGLTIDTDRLRPPLGADDKQPGDVVGK